MTEIARSIFRRLRKPTARQAIAVVAGLGLLVLGFAGLLGGHLAEAFVPMLLMQMLVIALLLLATHRISQRIADTGRMLLHSPTTIGRRDDDGTPSRTGSALAVLGACRFYARSNRDKQAELVNQLVLDRSLDGRDILAHEASRGSLDFNGICVLLECFRSPSKRATARRMAGKFDRQSLLSLARLLYRQDALAEDPLNAITLFELVKVVFGGGALSPGDGEWLVSALLQQRRTAEALAWMQQLGLSQANTPNHDLLFANATNPHVQPPATDEASWLQHFNRGFVAQGLEPLALAAGTGSPFSRLHADPVSIVEEGPLVSVIMPVHRPGPAIDVAIRSILAQSWRQLELIVVVDGGQDEHGAIEHWLAMDNRVRLIRCVNNRGTYTARNIGLDAARGEFVTCHDADDWSHPRKLELQARHLLSHPERIANTTQLLRVTDKLEIHHRSPSSSLAHPALVSLMFRREPVMARIGYWDTVRKMGDAEFMNRMQLAFDQKIEVAAQAPLNLALQDAGSLSGSDMHRGFMHPERQVYRARYREWHKRIAAGEASAWMPKAPPQRPFPAPASFLPVRAGVERFDVVFVSELGFTGGNAHSLIHEMSICIDAGLKVGLVHARNLLFTHLATREPIAGLVELLASGAVTELAITSQVQANLVIIRWPACFQFTSSLPSGIRAGRTIIVANHPPYERHKDRHSYEMAKVSRNARAVFGAEPEWAPQSDTIRRMLAPQLARGALLDIDWVAVLSEEPKAARRRRGPMSGMPVIGRHSRDHHLKWPGDRDTLLKVYPADGSVEVKVLGGIDQAIANGAINAEDVARWKVHAFGSLDPMEFLQTIDFFVYYHHKDWVEAFGRVIMEAMFAGAVVVLPPTFEPVFGDAALYAEPEDVQALIHACHGDWRRYEAQSERGMAYARDNCTPSAYRRRLAGLGLGTMRAEVQGAA